MLYSRFFFFLILFGVFFVILLLIFLFILLLILLLVFLVVLFAENANRGARDVTVLKPLSCSCIKGPGGGAVTQYICVTVRREKA